jgi:hypothetical protein
MRQFILASLLLATPVLAYGQGAPAESQKPSPEIQALSATVVDLISQNVSLRAQIIRLQAEIQAERKGASDNPASGVTPEPSPTK